MTRFPSLAFSTKRPCIAIVPLSGAASAGTDFKLGEEQLRNAGFEVINYYDPERRFQRFGATDTQRIELFYQALENPEVDLVMSLRGSYGVSRILPYLDFERIAAANKLVIGFSDINALQLAMLAKSNQGSLCGPMFCSDFALTALREFTQSHFQAALREGKSEVVFESDLAQEVELCGPLWGGNLAMLNHLVGTEFMPRMHGGILFLEDVAEHPYRVERMVLQLKMAGVLESQKALIFGDFSAYQLAEHDNGYNFNEMIGFLRQELSIPIFTGLPFGHCADKLSLFQGAQYQLHSNGSSVRLSAHIT
ncbi:LD-carboxypeptidase [Undibacterium cyanobacteriorum]|uniref:LD-carboxypeptidase n=1 Tax=Undibacterium cyanobacteriorum TaxID=3073561 RepID=A0ABY9RE53_9BURK|nr:LD-carboxypeptidase [Undibacterium sp. 20NA77.5]WMW78930.1 LD-carboxypeptidase [Undibacterium sp. 20NA77.5]